MSLTRVIPSLSLRAATVGLLQICLAGVLWGTGGVTLQVVRDHAPLSVLTVSAYRMLIAAAALLVAVALLRRARPLADLLRAAPGRAVLVGCGTAAYQALYFASVAATGVTVATAVSLGLAPVVLAVADAVRARRRPTPHRAAVLAAALGGLVAVSVASGGGATGPRPSLGLLLAVGSGTTYAATTALGRTLSQRTDPLSLTTVATAAGAVALVPVALLADPGAALVTTDPTALAALGYLGVLTMALAYGLLYAGLRTTSSTAAVLASLLEPVTAALLAAAVLGERITVTTAVGILLILAGVAGIGAEGGDPAALRTGSGRSRAGRPRRSG